MLTRIAADRLHGELRRVALAVPEPAATALEDVLELHAPKVLCSGAWANCSHCVLSDGNEDAYPCPTVETIAKALGVAVPDA